MSTRAKRCLLEEITAAAMIDAVKEFSPEMRDSIRRLLDGAMEADEIRRRFAAYKNRTPWIGLAIDWIVDEWERDRGLIGPDESIDAVIDVTMGKDG